MKRIAAIFLCLTCLIVLADRRGQIMSQRPKTAGASFSLISYWTLEEASGNRLDSKDSNHLVPSGANGSTTGIIGNGYQSVSLGPRLVKSNSANLIFDPAMGVTICGWFKLIPFAAGLHFVDMFELNMILTNGNQYTFDVQSIEGFGVPPDGLYGDFSGEIDGVNDTNFTIQLASIHSAWTFYALWFDPADTKLYFQINDGVKNNVLVTVPPSVLIDHAELKMGNSAAGNIFDEIAIYKGVLSDSNRTYLYNSGVGRTYPDVPQ